MYIYDVCILLLEKDSLNRFIIPTLAWVYYLEECNKNLIYVKPNSNVNKLLN